MDVGHQQGKKRERESSGRCVRSPNVNLESQRGEGFGRPLDSSKDFVSTAALWVTYAPCGAITRKHGRHVERHMRVRGKQGSSGVQRGESFREKNPERRTSIEWRHFGSGSGTS